MYAGYLDAWDLVFWPRDGFTSGFDEFVSDPDSNSAVMVQTARTAELGNPVFSFLAQWIGQESWDVRAN